MNTFLNNFIHFGFQVVPHMIFFKRYFLVTLAEERLHMELTDIVALDAAN